MDVPTLSKFLRPILTVSSVLNTGETGDIYNNWGGRVLAVALKNKTKSKKHGKIKHYIGEGRFNFGSILCYII